MTITSNFLCEPKPGELSHNDVSFSFAAKPGLVDWTLLLSELSAPTAAKMVEVTDRYGDTQEKNQTAFNVFNNTDLPYFDYVTHSPLWRKRFASYMKIVGESEGTSIKHLLNGFDWKGLGGAKVVDVRLDHSYLSSSAQVSATHVQTNSHSLSSRSAGPQDMPASPSRRPTHPSHSSSKICPKRSLPALPLFSPSLNP